MLKALLKGLDMTYYYSKVTMSGCYCLEVSAFELAPLISRGAGEPIGFITYIFVPSC